MQILTPLFLALFFILSPAAEAKIPVELTGRVVVVTDGDTIQLLTPEKELVQVRLAEIDAPEKNQPYGQKAKQALSALCFSLDVRAVVIDQDRYGRTVARLYKGDSDVNAEMVRQGAAWVYTKYLHDRTLLAVEQDARNAKRGLWSLQEDQRVPPWEWRKLKSKNFIVPQDKPQ